MTPRTLILGTAALFRSAGIPDPENDAALLLMHLTGIAPLKLRLDSDTELDPAVIASFNDLSARRMERIPLQYLIGEAPFFRRMFKVDSRVLIPRPETELLCEWALELVSEHSSSRILDLCCGSGAIGLTLKAERPDTSVTLSDISEDALNVAAVNAVRLSLDVSFRCTDLLNGFDPFSFDLIISNPPYIPSEECDRLQPEVLREPRLALDGGPDGFDLYRRIIEASYSVLVPGGLLLMELGINESEYLSCFLEEHGFVNIRTRTDFAGIDRMILAVRP